MPGNPVRVLVIDDDSVDRKIVRRALATSESPIDVEEADSAPVAGRMLADNCYDCIFLDYNLPGTDGLTFLRRLRTDGITTPVIVLTGQGDEQLAVELMKSGATDYLSKNALSPERLLHGLRSAVDLYRARQEAARAESDLRAATERFRLAADSAAVGTWDYSVATNEAMWDRRATEIFGLESTNRPLAHETFLERLHPSERAGVEAAVAAALDPSGEGLFQREYRIVLTDGRERWVDARGRALFEGEGEARHPVRFIGTVLDITERKRVEEALREEAEIVETLQIIGSSLTAELDLEKIVQAVTDESTRLTGAQFGAFFYNVHNESGEAYTLYTISGVPREAFTKFPMPRNTAVFNPTFEGTAIVRSDDITKDPRYGKNDPYFGMPKGHLPVVSYLAVPVKSHTGEVLGGLFFGHKDVGVFTKRAERIAIGIAGWAAVAMDNARLYQMERRSRGLAEEANAAKSSFLATMSHELRTPLNAIGGYAQLVEDGVYGPILPGQADAMQRIRKAQAHLLALINDILNFAKLEAGKIELVVEPVPVGRTLAELTPLIEPQSRSKDLKFVYSPPPTDITIAMDRDRVHQIMLNLLTNAVKFTPPGGAITLDWAATASDVVIHVRDTGIGISPEKLGRIFEPFVQVGQFRTDTNHGVGLGLAISRELARAMRGDLTATSVEGRGSVFTLTLPR